MGTKNNPGKFDCYHAAEPNEPQFTLLARDPTAPGLVALWAAIRLGDKEGVALAMSRLAESIDVIGNKIGSEELKAKADEALACANAMQEWRQTRTYRLFLTGPLGHESYWTTVTQSWVDENGKTGIKDDGMSTWRVERIKEPG